MLLLRRFITPFFLLAITLTLSTFILTSCTPDDNDQILDAEASEIETTDATTESDDDASDIVSAKRLAYLEDFDYFYQVLLNEFPFFGVVNRMTGVDLHESYVEVRDYIERTDFGNDQAFADVLSRFSRPITTVFGQEPVLSRWQYLNYLSWADESNASSFTRGFPAIYELLTNPQTLQFYRWAIYDAGTVDSDEEDISDSPTDTPVATSVVRDTSHDINLIITTRGGVTATIRIDHFTHETWEQEGERILAFLESVSDYENLILQLSHLQWISFYAVHEGVIAHLVSEPYSSADTNFLHGRSL